MKLKEECYLIKIWQSPEMIEIIRKWAPVILPEPKHISKIIGSVA